MGVKNATRSIQVLVLVFFCLVCSANGQDVFHVFPQFADGRLADGSVFRSTVMINEWFGNPTRCVLRLNGMSAEFPGLGEGSEFTIEIPDNGFFWGRTTAAQELRSGYATLSCDDFVFATVVYTFYTDAGGKVTEATVFSSDPYSSSKTLLVDETEGARVGVAIANDTDAEGVYTLELRNPDGGHVVTSTLRVPARTAVPAFVDELVELAPSGTVRILKVASADSSEFSMIGIRVTGALYTTVPAN